MSGLHAVTLSILLIFVPGIIGNQSCSLDTCDTNGSTIVVNASDGGFCNKMSNMMALIYLKLVYQMQIFLPLDHYNILASVFPQIHARPAEKYIPGFEEKYQEFLLRQRAHKNQMMRDFIRQKEGNPHLAFALDSQGLARIPRRYLESEYISDLLANDKYRTLPEDSMPGWVLFNKDDFSFLEKQGLTKGQHHILLYYPSIYLEEALKTPGYLEQFESNFQLHPRHLKAANQTMGKIIEHKKWKKTTPLWIGVHVRRQDFPAHEKSLGLVPLKPSYYLQAMDLCREFYSQSVIFLVITDDVSWCEKHVKKRSKDVFIVSDPQADKLTGIGHDLAVMSKCNHSIISRGSFSYFVSNLAGGATVLPCHFKDYKHKEYYSNCERHPLKNPLPKLYPLQY